MSPSAKTATLAEKPPAEVAAGPAAADGHGRPPRLDLYGDASPGERATGDAGQERVEAAGDAGGAIDWSKASRGGGSFEGLMATWSSRLHPRAKTLAEHLHDQLSALAGFDAGRTGRWPRP